MRILLVKLSSLGDVIHTLPAISDLVHFYPDISLDWLVDEAFAEIPTLHPGVHKVKAIPLRSLKNKKGV